MIKDEIRSYQVIKLILTGFVIVQENIKPSVLMHMALYFPLQRKTSMHIRAVTLLQNRFSIAGRNSGITDQLDQGKQEVNEMFVASVTCFVTDPHSYRYSLKTGSKSCVSGPTGGFCRLLGNQKVDLLGNHWE